MTACPEFTHLLVLPHLQVQNANAISSPLTHGFPSMTAFLGLMWALERKLVAEGVQHLSFNAVGVVSHGWQEQITEAGFVNSFRLTRNPIGKDGKTAAIVEEGRIHLDLSLVFAIHADEWADTQQAADVRMIADFVSAMRIAGGSVLPPQKPWQARYQPWLSEMGHTARQENFRMLRARLLPGSTLVSRDELIDQRLAQLRAEEPNARALDAWLSLSRVDWRYNGAGDGGKGEWLPSRKRGDGWIVPIPVGYGAISDVYEAGKVRHARDSETPFRFVESLYSTGEWIGPHRLRAPEELLWWADNSQTDVGLYRCRNGYRPPASLPADL